MRRPHATARDPRVPISKIITCLLKKMSTVEQLLNMGAKPTYSGNRLMLRSGRRLKWLSKADGKLTAAGNEYEARAERQLPASGLQQQTPQRKGNTETIKLRNGKRVISRRFDGDEWHFTKAGD